MSRLPLPRDWPDFDDDRLIDVRTWFAVLLTVQAMNDLHSGGHRVFL